MSTVIRGAIKPLIVTDQGASVKQCNKPGCKKPAKYSMLLDGPDGTDGVETKRCSECLADEIRKDVLTRSEISSLWMF